MFLYYWSQVDVSDQKSYLKALGIEKSRIVKNRSAIYMQIWTNNNTLLRSSLINNICNMYK